MFEALTLCSDDLVIDGKKGYFSGVELPWGGENRWVYKTEGDAFVPLWDVVRNAGSIKIKHSNPSSTMEDWEETWTRKGQTWTLMKDWSQRRQNEEEQRELTTTTQEVELISATHGHTHGRTDMNLQTYDDTFGPLWLYCDTYGPIGIVRTQTISDAWDIILDEFLKPIPAEDILEAYGIWLTQYDEQGGPQHPCGWFWVADVTDERHGPYKTRQDAEDMAQQLLQDTEHELIEGYEYQPNMTGTGIVQVDHNNSLAELTTELCEVYNIKLTMESTE